jgi:phenylacetate-CoA ligase
MLDKIYKNSPNFIQNILITIFNFLAYKKRYGGKYKNYLNIFKQNRHLSKVDLDYIQIEKFRILVLSAYKSSSFYKELYGAIKNPQDVNNLQNLPIVNKEMFRQDLKRVYTINKEKAIVSKTGGTTGKSLEVLFTNDNMQERFAMLDDFRSRFGYKLGKKTAWFSGKSLLNKNDLKKNRFWKTDNWYNVRYYSTFHIKESYLRYYIENLINYKTEFIVGFPSSLLDIAKFGLKNNYFYPEGMTKAIFPTAESITEEMKFYIEKFFKAPMYNQYASSEGAPFIFECVNKNLHLELQSGVFEVLDESDKPVKSGRLVVTSFTTSGTPLIRYDIGDSIELSDEICTCGNNNPLVKEIFGRIDDYIYSPENGKINLGNISNTLKDTEGIVKFQAIQNKIDEVSIRLQVDNLVYNKKIENIFMNNWRDRLGDKMNIDFKYVDTISVEKSGKFRFVKNNIKHLIEND